MYNLIVGAQFEGAYGTIDSSRVLDESPSGGRDVHGLPTLVMPERNRNGWDHGEQLARLGHVSHVNTSTRDTRFQFTPSPTPPIAVEEIYRARASLSLTSADFTWTRWQIKQPDLYQVVVEGGLLQGRMRPTAFKLPETVPEPNRIAVMMPFGGSFDAVWEGLQRVAKQNGWICERADSIWVNSRVLDDIVLLIARSTVVICDLTNKNANVFYETGLTHMLGRQTVLLTQSKDDVPFDLQAERYLSYYPNKEGIEKLQIDLELRLRTLLKQG